jgi:hypothetical protein
VKRWLPLAALVATASVVTALPLACTGAGASREQAADAQVPSDGATEGPADAPAGDVASPSTPAPFPTVEYLGGPILSAPRVVTVTFPEDDPSLVARLQLFDDTITGTAWWTQVAHEYCVSPGGSPCVGPGSGGGHVVMPNAALQAYTDSVRGGDATIRQLVADNVADGAFPAPDAQTLYVLYMPTGVRVLLDGLDICQHGGSGGYHDSIAVAPDGGTPLDVAYAVVGRCSSTEAATTLTASHEIVEAATDPSPEGAPAFQMTDFAWLAFGGEVADVCAAVDTNFETQASGFTVQRSWSNASAAARHDPCVPVPAGEVFFDVAPSLATGGHLMLGVGQSVTLDLVPFADGATSDWQLTAIDPGPSPVLSLTLDRATVHVGDAVHLTVTLQTMPQKGSDELFGLASQSANDLHAWPMTVHAQ